MLPYARAASRSASILRPGSGSGCSRRTDLHQDIGLIGGVIAGTAAAVTFCGLLAIAIRIRELLEECLRELRRGGPAE